MKAAITFLEMMTVVIIIGILATLGVNHFGMVREQALCREAIAQLRLIQATENVILLETNAFVECDDDGLIDPTACNAALDLVIPIVEWHYSVDVNAAGNDYTVTATRQDAGACFYTITRNAINPVNNGCVLAP
ncbi:MAG: type II secretion system protein [Candidatus Omnitrophota bacterium]|nr:MAG: type II secretion system protein [Candidatus Omnitrophota bacterium]